MKEKKSSTKNVNEVSEATDFSRLITKYIEESGYSVYKLSQLSELGRTAIQHLMAGSLLPTKDFVERLAKVLPITPTQYDELINLYIKTKIGTNTFNERIKIKEIIENITKIQLVNGIGVSEAGPIDPSVYDNHVITGQYNVANVLVSLLKNESESENGRAYITVPLENKLFSDVLHMLIRSNSKLKLEHYLRIYKQEISHPEISNLETLQSALDISLHSGGDYTPYYFYSFKSSADDIMPAFPYCVVTNNYSAGVTADLSSMCITSNKDFRGAYINHIKHIAEHSFKLISTMNIMEMANVYSKEMDKLCITINSDPCILKYINKDVVDMYINPQLPDLEYFRNLANEIYIKPQKKIADNLQKFTSYLSVSGLHRFAETGRLEEIPSDFYLPVSVEDRIHFIELIKNDKLFKIFDKTKMNIPRYVELSLYTNKKLLISCYYPGKERYCTLSEPGIYTAFEDFINSAEDSGLLLSEKAKKEVAADCIDYLNRLKQAEEVPALTVPAINVT